MSITVSTFSTLIHIMSLVGLRMLVVCDLGFHQYANAIYSVKVYATDTNKLNCIYPQPNSVPCEWERHIHFFFFFAKYITETKCNVKSNLKTTSINSKQACFYSIRT